MIKNLLVCMALASAAASSFAQSAAAMTRVAPATASAPVKYKWIKKLKNHKPGAAAINPEASVDKKGGA